MNKKSIFLGQDLNVLYNQVLSLVFNLKSWFFEKILPRRPSVRPITNNTCVAIEGPGGLDRLVWKDIPSGKDAVTLGYNLPNMKAPYFDIVKYDVLDKNLVIIQNNYFSINYADIAIRWGLYESALRYVGWPIVPGFDFSGTIEWAGSESGYKTGDKVFGFTLFGAYSSRILCPAHQIRTLPPNITFEQGAAIPAVAGTALHAISLAGAWPQPILSKNKAALIHSAAGGVGSMLVQMCKLVGFSPVVAVVGSSHKIDVCKSIGADYVIDKSTCDLWTTALKISPNGYAAIFDANGVETLMDSYNYLDRCGKLIIYGFHTNLPKAAHLLSPWSWLQMIKRLAMMPKFDPMALVLESKAVSGFNLSFFAEETDLIDAYMNQILAWICDEKLKVSEVTVFDDMSQVGQAHAWIQSGQSIGKIVVKCR